MKLLYIILFLLDTAILVLLCLLLLWLFDKHSPAFTLIATIAGIILSIVLLIFCLDKYTNLPTGSN
ncbi:MAG: hypothetical protein IT254_12170 [Chitinophagaceae bacterium]|nr:hypothetical protein [Bacteroidota bacterium]MCC6259071.1 hypothetical protein [Chitinophagaceae bacterium]MCW5916391.1 hypothetical protein [Ferruginibacter sp.]